MKTILFPPFFILFGLISVSGVTQNLTVSGYVTHFFTGNAVDNVNVFETHSGIGTITNNDGFFNLILKQGEMNLSFAQNGFKPVIQQFSVKNDTIMNIHLEPLKWINAENKSELHSKSENIQKAFPK